MAIRTTCMRRRASGAAASIVADSNAPQTVIAMASSIVEFLVPSEPEPKRGLRLVTA